jgi:hypothetical protein
MTMKGTRNSFTMPHFDSPSQLAETISKRRHHLLTDEFLPAVSYTALANDRTRGRQERFYPMHALMKSMSLPVLAPWARFDDRALEMIDRPSISEVIQGGT